MSAYIVFTREKMRSESHYQTYQKMVPGTLAGQPVAVRVRYGRHEVMEGANVEGVVILEFPSFEEAKAWYHSPAYREAREYRFLAADYRAVIVEGVSAAAR